LVDVINIHLVPMLLGSGTSLFGELRKSIELEKVSVKDEPDATHLTYKVKK
jgi:riboflavin biosynthesis pyrimidine reductase